MMRVNRAVLIATLAVAYPSYGWGDQTALDRNPFLSIEEQTVRPVEDRPIQRTIERLTRPSLMAIVSHSGDAVAVIGGQIVRVGDEVESKDVVEITAEQVWLQDHDTRYLMELSDVVEFVRDRGASGPGQELAASAAPSPAAPETPPRAPVGAGAP
jgi:hypothetical protein